MLGGSSPGNHLAKKKKKKLKFTQTKQEKWIVAQMKILLGFIQKAGNIKHNREMYYRAKNAIRSLKVGNPNIDSKLSSQFLICDAGLYI